MTDSLAIEEPSPRPWHVRMSGRDPNEAHRASTPLELLFDLSFVVAVSVAASELHHALTGGDIAYGLINYIVIFFAIWWPWVNFTWFASAYDTDDVPYRLLTFVQIVGVLIVTAGIPSAFERLDFTIMVIGYLIMRIALVAQWLRVALEDPVHRPTAMRFAIGITLIQVAWAGRLAIGPPWGFAIFGLLGLLELAVPIWAEMAGPHTPWNAHHVTERYGLFTIIVIGECILGAATTVQVSFNDAGASAALLTVAVGGLLLVFDLWWMYFKGSEGLPANGSLRAGILWSYGHFFVFTSVAALGAGLQVATDTTRQASSLGPAAAAATVAVPIVVYTLAVATLHGRSEPVAAIRSVLVPVLLVLGAAVAATWIGVPLAIVTMGLIVAGLVSRHVVRANRLAQSPPAATADRLWRG